MATRPIVPAGLGESFTQEEKIIGFVFTHLSFYLINSQLLYCHLGDGRTDIKCDGLRVL